MIELLTLPVPLWAVFVIAVNATIGARIWIDIKELRNKR